MTEYWEIPQRPQRVLPVKWHPDILNPSPHPALLSVACRLNHSIAFDLNTWHLWSSLHESRKLEATSLRRDSRNDSVKGTIWATSQSFVKLKTCKNLKKKKLRISWLCPLIGTWKDAQVTANPANYNIAPRELSTSTAAYPHVPIQPIQYIFIILLKRKNYG